MKSYDCIVIGGGVAGLTYALLARRAGWQVLLLEQHYLPGGLFTAFRQGRYLFNVAMEWTTDCGADGEFTRLLQRLGIDGHCIFADVSVFKTVRSCELQRPVPLYCCEARLRDELTKAFPREADAIRRFFGDVLASTSVAPDKRLLQAASRPAERFLRDYFSDSLLRQTLCSITGCPGAIGLLLVGMLQLICTRNIYVPHFRDHRTLALALGTQLKRSGSGVRYRTLVEQILIDDGQVRGVRLSNGESIDAANVVAAVDEKELYGRLLPSGCDDANRRSVRQGRDPGLSTFCVFAGLRRRLTGMEDRMALLAASERWESGSLALDCVPMRMEYHDHPRWPTLSAWVPTNIAELNFWGQGRDCEDSELNRPAYEEAKACAARIVLDRIEHTFPGLSESIEVLNTASPFTFKRYTRNEGGSISGASLANVRYLRTLSSTTSIKGLQHIGHSTVQSGVSTVMMAAAQAFDAHHGASVHSELAIRGV